MDYDNVVRAHVKAYENLYREVVDVLKDGMQTKERVQALGAKIDRFLLESSQVRKLNLL